MDTDKYNEILKYLHELNKKISKLTERVVSCEVAINHMRAYGTDK